MRPNAQFLVSNRSHRFIASLLLAGLVSSSGFATDYSVGGSIDVNAVHNDNIRLVPRDKTAVTKYQAAPAFTLKAATETSTLELNSAFDFNRYNKSEFNSDDQNISLALAHQLENSSVGLNAAVIRNTTITSELLTSGVIGNKAERTELYQIAPNWMYTFNETNQLQISGSYSIQDYHSAAYTGYKNYGGELDWIHIINERLKWIVAATYSNFHSDDIDLQIPNGDIRSLPIIDADTGQPLLITVPKGIFGSQSYSTRTKDKGIQLGVDYQWSESSLLQARLGRSNNNTSHPVKDPDDICSNANYQRLVRSGVNLGLCNFEGSSDQLSTAQLNWTWHSELQKFGLSATKSTQPSANGYTVDALLVSSNWSYQLTERDQISAGLALTRNRALNEKSAIQNTSIANRNYLSTKLGYQRQINEKWFLNASYEFSSQKYTDIDYKANAKAISIGVQYRPSAWHWSR